MANQTFQPIFGPKRQQNRRRRAQQLRELEAPRVDMAQKPIPDGHSVFGQGDHGLGVALARFALAAIMLGYK